MVSLGNERDVDVDVWPAEADDAIVVQIDTGEKTGRIRVNLNDSPIYDGRTERDEVALVFAFRQVEAFEARAQQMSLDLGELRADLATKLRKMGVNL